MNIFVITLMFLINLGLFAQNINVKVKTSISIMGKEYNKNITTFYDASDYPFIKQVDIKAEKDSIISLPIGKYIVKADFPDYTYNASIEETYFPRHFLSDRKSLWESTIYNFTKDTTLEEELENPYYEYNSSMNFAYFSILDTDKDTIKSVVITVYKVDANTQNKSSDYLTSIMFIEQQNKYNMLVNHNNHNYLFLFDYSGKYLPGYLTSDFTVTQALSKAKQYKIGKKGEHNTITMEKVIPPNGNHFIRGILDSTVLQIVNKNDYEIQSNNPIQWGIIVAYNEQNQPVGFSLTDVDGKFEIKNLNTGKYRIEANFHTMNTNTEIEIDELGNSKELKITLDVENQDNQFIIYPNPVGEVLQFSFNKSVTSNFLYKILDLNGNVISNNNIQYINNNKYSIDIGDLANGVYYLYLKDGHQIKYQKFIK